MSKHIKEEVTEFNKRNGNLRLNQGELLTYLVSRWDKMEDRLNKIDEKLNNQLNKQFQICSNRFMPQSMFKLGFGLLFTLLGGLAYYIFIG